MPDSFSLQRLEPDDPRPPFECQDADLNEFFQKDSIVGGRELLSVTYVAERGGSAIAFFSVSNDSIKKELLPRSRFEKLIGLIPRPKRYSSMPAVKIGRLATQKELERQGIGTELLDFIKVWFTEGNKTGCRFVIVDAYNKQKVINFYKKNGFDFLLPTDKDDGTRLMYFDLIRFQP